MSSLIIVGIANTGVLAEPDAPTSERLACAAWIDNADLRLGERFKLTAAIECKKGICFVYAPIGFGSLGFLTTIKTSSGDLVPPPFELSAHSFATKFLSDEHDFLKLYAGMIEGAYIERNVSDFFPTAGEYTVGVSYQSPIIRLATAVTDAIVREDGPIFSPLLKIQVR